MLIISREYTTRVKKKGFIITTLVMPLFMVAMMVAPTLLMSLDDGRDTITIIDRTEQLLPSLLTDQVLAYTVTDEPVDSAIANPEYKRILVIGENAIDDPTDIVLYNRDAESLQTLTILSDNIQRAIEDIRLSRLGHDNLREILSSVEANVEIKSMSLTDSGETEDSNVFASFFIGIAMAFILYMFILIYGQMVMTSIIEEKNNRVLEIIVTSVNPTQLMLGKLIGIGVVAVTQVLIWVAIIVSVVAFVIPEIASPDMMTAMTALTNLSYVLSISGYLLLFLVGGFLLYASLYAAIGAAVDNVQDGSQLQSFALIPVIIGLIFSTAASENPNSVSALWLSIIPFTSPMVMMARIPAGVPTIEIVSSIVLLYATIFFCIWFAAKIYRVGIFMYGKKPTIKELIKWARYK